jgi:hypothetical protein
MKNILITEEEKKHILKLHKNVILNEWKWVSNAAKEIITNSIDDFVEGAVTKNITPLEAKNKLINFFGETADSLDVKVRDEINTLIKNVGNNPSESEIKNLGNQIKAKIDAATIQADTNISTLKLKQKELEVKLNAESENSINCAFYGRQPDGITPLPKEEASDNSLMKSFDKTIDDIYEYGVKITDDTDPDIANIRKQIFTQYPDVYSIIEEYSRQINREVVKNVPIKTKSNWLASADLVGVADQDAAYLVYEQSRKNLRQYIKNKLIQKIKDHKCFTCVQNNGAAKGKTLTELYNETVVEPIFKGYKTDPQGNVVKNVDIRKPNETTKNKFLSLEKQIEDNGWESLSDTEKKFYEKYKEFKEGAETSIDEINKLGDEATPKVPLGADQKLPEKWKTWFKPIGDFFYYKFYPYWRVWIKSSTTIFRKSNSYDKFSTLFYKKFLQSLQGGNVRKIPKADMYRLMYSLADAPEQFANNISKLGGDDENLIKKLYENFKLEGEKYFEGKYDYINGQQVDLKAEFQKFCQTIENFEESGNYNLGKERFLGFKKLIEEAPDDESIPNLKTLKKEVGDDVKFDARDPLNPAVMKKAGEGLWSVIRTKLSNFWSLFRGGSWKTPADIERIYAERFQKGGRNAKTSAINTKLGWWKIGLPLGKQSTAALILWRQLCYTLVVLPICTTVLAMLWDMIISNFYSSAHIEAMKEFYGDKEPYTYDDFITIGKYFWYSFVKQYSFRDLLRDMIKDMPGNYFDVEEVSYGIPTSWKDFFIDAIDLLPGSDISIYALIIAAIVPNNSGELDEKETAEKTQAVVSDFAKHEQEQKIIDIDNGFKEEQNKLFIENGENYNTPEKGTKEFSAWLDYFYKTGNENIHKLYKPEFLPGQYSYMDSLKINGTISDSLYDYFSKSENKELIWGLNPAIVVKRKLLEKSNKEKDEYGTLAKKVKNFLNDEQKQINMGKKLADAVLNLDKDPDVKKASPFVVLKKNNKKYILDSPMFWSDSAPADKNYVTFYTPDYQTMMNALKDPKQKLVANNYVETKKDKENGVKIVRVKQNPITEFMQLNENKYISMKNNKTIVESFIRILREEEEKEEFRMKEWDDAFTFQKIDDKNPGTFKDVEIKMKDVMERMPHWRRRYKKECEDNNEKGDKGCDDGEDDSFVRAVIDTHPDVVRILVTKGLANITTSDEKIKMEEGFSRILGLIREERNAEVEVWSVYRHKSSPDKIWSLVKGDFKQKEMESMEVQMQKSPSNDVKKKEDTLTSLKKKELSAIENLKKNEKNGIFDLPRKLREKLQDSFLQGWTTEIPNKELLKFYEKKDLRSTFNDSVQLYKIKNADDFFTYLEKSSSNVVLSRGFCKTMVHAKKESNLSSNQKRIYDHFLNKCESKFEGKFGVRSFDMK